MTEQNVARERGPQQVKVGRVVSDRQDKTVIVAVVNTVMHTLYRRRMKKTSKFYAHDPENSCRMGDVVQIVSTRPLSKLKRWKVSRVVERAEG